ncbi:MAG: helix-turn-helix domain-containing protein [Chloroflexi bacterium]|nr:helix-turn-helix domain-containing protein [Chloroflexota bacterium]
MDKLLLRPEEAAALLSLGRSTIYELIASGALESVTVGRSRRVPLAALERFVRERMAEAGER